MLQLKKKRLILKRLQKNSGRDKQKGSKQANNWLNRYTYRKEWRTGKEET